MSKSYRIASWVVALGLTVIMSGCSSQASQEKPKGTTPAEKNAIEAAPAGIPKGLAELSAADRAAAEKQRVCPVSGDVLGAMDTPYKVTVKGQIVFLCCPACEKELLKNPDKYLAKMKTGTSK